MFLKPDPIIEKIELTEEQKQEIRDVMDGKPTQKHIEKWDEEGTRTTHERHYKPVGALEDRLRKIRQKYFNGGKCVMCHNFPLVKVIYKMDDVTLVEYYCDNCFEKSGIK